MGAAVDQKNRAAAPLEVGAADALAAAGSLPELPVFLRVFFGFLLFVRVQFGEFFFETFTDAVDDDGVGASRIGHDLEEVLFDHACGQVLVESAAHGQQVDRLHLFELRVAEAGKDEHGEKGESSRSHPFHCIWPGCYSNRLYKSLSITVIIPCLNEEQGIEKVLSRMPAFVDQVIVVDNGSTDRTPEVAQGYGAQVIREEVRGYGRAYKSGFAKATSDVIITLDGDHSYPVDAISYLVEAMLHLEADFLNASRFPVRDRKAMSFKHKFGNWVLSVAMSVLFFRWVRDSQSGMWVFRRSILRGMRLDSDGMAFSEEIKIEALKNSKVRFQEISIQYSSRLGEVKLNPWRDGFANLWFLVKKRFQA